MAAKEVSCKTLTIFFKSFEEHNIPLETLCEDLPYNLEYLKNTNENIEWETLRKFLLNIRQIWNDDDHFVNLGIQMIQKRAYPFFSLISGLFLNVKDVYHLINDPKKGMGNRHVKCITPATTEIEKGHLEVTLELPDNYIKSREFFLVTKGFFTALPLFLKLKFSKVTMHETAHGAVYNIFYPQSNAAYLWLRNIFSSPSSKRAAITELNDAYELLYDRFHELKKSQTKIRQQSKLLETAYSISQLIIGDIDLDYTLKAIAKSLIEVAEFEAVEIVVDTEIDGEKISRNEKFGSKNANSFKIERVLKGRSQNIGKLLLWTNSNTNSENVQQLLDYIIPSISMQLLSALSFKLVDDYRSKLELKVNERTTQLNQANKELSASIEKLKELKSTRDRFFANISHEFRTPITVTLGLLDKAYSYLKENRAEQFKTLMHIVRRNNQKLLSLVNEILDLAMLETKTLDLHPVSDNIVIFIRSCVELLESYAASRSIAIKFEDTGKLVMDFDPPNIQKIINNLISNAVKFTPEGGEIQVTVSTSVRQEHSYLRFEVKDNGIGIPHEDIPRIFDRFYQSKNSNTAAREGSGIGLSLTKELVALMGGEIQVESQLKIGTTFTVLLPVTHHSKGRLEDFILNEEKESISLETLIDDNESEEASLENKRNSVLIIEDNEDVQYYIQLCLKDQYDILTAKNGDAGIGKALKHIPDVIISDVMMPGKDGLEVCQILKDDRRTSHIPIILLTAKALVEDKIMGLKYGADAYLIKPFNVGELHAQIENLIRSRAELFKKFSVFATAPKASRKEQGKEYDFLISLNEYITKELDNPQLNMEQLCRNMNMSRTQLYRKITALTGKSATAYIRSYRLHRARELALNSTLTFQEIAFETGFNDPSYFHRAFLKEFGKTPGTIRKQ